MSFWAFINKTLHFGPFGYYYCSCSSDLGFGRFGPHFFKEGAPLAPGPTFGPWVEFWVQLRYPQRFSSLPNQSRCDTWRDTKNHPSQSPTALFTPFGHGAQHPWPNSLSPKTHPIPSHLQPQSNLLKFIVNSSNSLRQSK